MTIESIIALIPALPLAGFLFAVLAGSRVDRFPAHGHDAHGAGHADDHGSHSGHGSEGAAHAEADESAFRPIPTEEEQRATSPHAGHADDLANSNGADGVIPDDLNDGLGQVGHVVEGGDHSFRVRSARRPDLEIGRELGGVAAEFVREVVA